MKKKTFKILLNICFLFLVASVFFPPEAFAPPLKAVSSSSSGFLLATLDALLLLGVLFCFFCSLKVKSFLREGELSSGWVLFAFAFAILFIGQLLCLFLSSGLFDIPLLVVSLTRLLSIFSLSLGIYFMKKVLS